MTEPVVLAVCLAADPCKAVTLHDSLETFSFRSTDNVHIGSVRENICNCEHVAQFKLLSEVCLELDKLALRRGSCLFEMPHKRSAGMLLADFVIGKLYSGITIFLNCTDLRDYAWTSLNDGAWNILSIGTENGSHSDFLNNLYPAIHFCGLQIYN